MTDTTKYENTILYLCKALGGSIRDKKKLAKLLYFVDFDRYEYKESMVSVTGTDYVAQKMGPLPCSLDAVIDDLISKDMISVKSVNEYDGYIPTEVYTCNREPDMSIFDSDDTQILDNVVNRYGRLTGKQLENLSHAEAPWLGTQRNDVIDYSLTFYRGTFDDVSFS